MKVAVICFHKNIGRYPQEWIEKYKKSILDQTYRDYTILELNYGGKEERIFENSVWFSLEMEDHAQAHNYLLDKAFELGYEYVLNTNVDDYYPETRFEIQVREYDPVFSVISGNYIAFDEKSIGFTPTNFHTRDIEYEFNKNHNIIAHPACGYTRKFKEYREKLISEEIPADDFSLWKRLLAKGAKFKILSNSLMYYRISNLKTKTNV